MIAYYNEIDPYAAQWLRNLIAARHIAPGDVDERSIVDVRGDDLRGYDQCHFFAGIGGWSFALRLAGWPDDRPVWTGSCPCQPFSAAGKNSGGEDERHLWPHWFPLVRECKPAIVFGEQVEAAIGWGWLDAVLGDLEEEGYATGACVLGAHSVGAPHIRQRLWFVANATERDQRGHSGEPRGETIARGGQARPQDGDAVGGAGTMGLVADADGGNTGAEGLQRGGEYGQQQKDGVAGIVGHADQQGSQGRRIDAREHAGQRSPWEASDWLPCTDGKSRPVEPLAQQMVDGLSGGMGFMRADQQLEKEIRDAATSVGLGDEVLRAMRQGHGARQIWQSLGRCLGFSQATLLLACLCEQSRELGQFFHSKASCSEQADQGQMREMWPTPRANKRGFPDSHGSWAAPSPCPPLGWQLPEQLVAKLADALPKVPQAGALNAFNGSPLSINVPGRVGRLRAYGNAIVPQVAAEFIMAAATREA